MENLYIYLLGTPYVELDRNLINLVTRKNIAFLAYLAVMKGQHNREELITLLWPDLDPTRARANLRRDLSVMRKKLGGEGIMVDGEFINLDPGCNYYLDIDHFHALLQGCEEHHHGRSDSCQECINNLISATDLYRGNFLEGFSLRDSPNFDEWQFFQTESLRQEFANGLEILVQSLFTQEQSEAAISYAGRWLALDPLNEVPHRELMKLYVSSDQRNAALRQYRECVRLLQDELGVSPEEDTTALFDQIKNNLYPAKRKRSEPQTDSRHKYTLPVQTTPFIGRECELEKLSLMLDDPDIRLITILGAGGMGKTHLALELGKEILDQFPDGVYFVPLASLDSVNSIVPTVAKALDISFYESIQPGEQLLEYLSQKNLLLIMDNFEHILEGNEWVNDVINRTIGIKILATSKVKLNLSCEHLFPIYGMDYPPLQNELGADNYPTFSQDLEQYSAIKLFSLTARQNKPDFIINKYNFHDVVKICGKVQGMPLAILLAAAWVGTIEPSEIASEIDKGLDFLESDFYDVPERHRSLHAVFEYTWQLLTEREQEIFIGLSVFRGGFTRHAYKEVIGGPIGELRTLKNKSLLIYNQTNLYVVHELLRQIAEVKLKKVPNYYQKIQQRHAAFFATYLNRWEAEINGSNPLQALAEIEIEIGNARKAWIFAVNNNDINLINQAIEGINNFYIWKKRYQEGVNTCDLAVKNLDELKSGPISTIIPRILIWRTIFNLRLGQTEEANEDLQQASRILNTLKKKGIHTHAENAAIQFQKGNIAFDHNLDEAQNHYEKSLTLFREANDSRGTADALMSLGWVNWHRGAYETANILFEESHVLRRSLGDKRGNMESQSGLGFLAMFQGNFEEAERMILDGHALLEEIGINANLIYDFMGKKDIAANIENEHELITQYRKSVGLYSDLGFRYSLAPVHSIYGYIKKHLGHYEQAILIGKMGYVLASKIGWKQEVGFCLELLGDIAIVNRQYTQAEEYITACISIYQETKQLDISSAFASLGYIALFLGKYTQAQNYLAKSLRKATEVQAQYPITHAIPAVALLLVSREEEERAIELYALATRYQRVANSHWFDDVVGKKIKSLSSNLPSEVISAAEKRGIKRDLQTTVRELILELESGQMIGELLV